MGNINAGKTILLDGSVKGREGNFALLYTTPAFDLLMGGSENTTISTSDCKSQAQAGGASC